MKHGYARCSTNETKQDINRQVRELKAAGAEEIFLEYEHGDSKVKSQQAAMFAQAQAGDTIITLEVPRLARSTQQLCEIIDRVREKRLRLVIVGSITLDCREGRADPMSEAFLQMAGVFSQLELSMIRERVRSGMANAKAKGKQIVSGMSDDGKRVFEEYQELRERMCYISEEDSFVNGFRIGVGLLLDAIGTYDSQFVRYHED